MCAVAVSIQYLQRPLRWYGKVQEGKWWSQRFPPPFSCHKSCLAAQNKLLLETSLLALYPLPFITSEELQKAKKQKFTTSYSCNLWTNSTNISEGAFLSWRQDNVFHLCNHSFLLPLWPFGELNGANCSSFGRRDGYILLRHGKIFNMERFFQG